MGELIIPLMAAVYNSNHHPYFLFYFIIAVFFFWLFVFYNSDKSARFIKELYNIQISLHTLCLQISLFLTMQSRVLASD